MTASSGRKSILRLPLALPAGYPSNCPRRPSSAWREHRCSTLLDAASAVSQPGGQSLHKFDHHRPIVRTQFAE